MHLVVAKAPVNGRPMVAQRSGMVRPRLMTVVRSAPSKDQIGDAIKDAKEACEGGDAGEWYVIWFGVYFLFFVVDLFCEGSCVGGFRGYAHV